MKPSKTAQELNNLVLDVSSEQHQIIKALAATEGKSIKSFMLKQVRPKTDAGEAEAWDALKNLLSERLQSAVTHGVTTKHVSDITEDALKALGKA